MVIDDAVLHQEMRHRRDVGEVAAGCASTSGSSVRRLAAISGSAAFLAPPIGIVPASGTPPRIRILSIVSASPSVPPGLTGRLG